MAGAVGVDADPGYIVGNTLDPTMWKNCVMYLPQLEDMWGYVCRNTLETFCIRGAQIDKFGNVNNSVIGDFKKPKGASARFGRHGRHGHARQENLYLVDHP